jgi:FkbM family methyltransferase
MRRDPRSIAVRQVSRLGNERLRALGASRAAGPLLRRLGSGAITVPSGRGQGLQLDLRHIPLAHAHLAGLAYGLVEQPVQEALRRHLGPGDVLYDVGANVGFFALIGARFVAPGGHVYALEPAPDNAAAVRANAQLNDLGHVTVLERAAGARAGTAALQVVEDQSWSKLAATGEHPLTTRVLDVEVVALDDLVEGGLRPPTLVKIDVEGFELEVLEGMRRTLERHRPAVICELHDTHAPFAAFARDAGYRVINLEGPGPVEEAGPSAHALALPEGHPGD